MKVEKNIVVSMHYTLSDDAGEIIDSSMEHAPLDYIQGMGQIVPGLENAMEGHVVGDKFKVTVSPAEGYGERDEDLMDRIPLSAFPDVEEIQPGMEFYADGPNGPVMITIQGVEGDEAIVDGNHPLAGQTLHFAIEVVALREATAEEMDHGHVHGEHDHHHD